MLKSFLLFLFLLGLNFAAHSQSQGRVYDAFQDASVVVNGQPILSPWCGGINSVMMNLADINQDGKKDLVLFDHINLIVRTFVNTGTAGDIHYTYEPKFEKNFPTILNYLLLRDYNCDGVPDLFHKGISGVSVYKGYYQSGELKFTYYKDLYFPGSFGLVNVYVQPDDIPAIQDVDGDGDLDVVSFDVNGNRLVYVKNSQVEDGLPCDSMKMQWVSDCYGKFYQSIYRTCVLNSSCKGFMSNKGKRHAGNCLVLLDIEGDGDLDFLGGNISYNDVQLMINDNTSANAHYALQDTMYNATGHVLELPSWPAPFHLDIDNDGDKDLLFTTHNENSSAANEHVVAFYKNTGSDLNPNFVYQHDSLLSDEMIDVGSFSYPVFFDYDKDGKPDLFVGNEAALNNANNTIHTRIAYYHNTTIGAAISFELVSRDFLSLSTNNYNGVFPTFGDLTGDGISDLVIGHKNGSVSVYKNYATSNVATPNFMFYTDSVSGVTAGAYSFPLVYDYNQDGRTDLLLGNQTGKIIYYEDTSTTNVKKLALQTISLGGIKAGDMSNIYGYCAPTIAKMDETNKEYLVIGNVDGTLARYDDFINNVGGNFTRIDSNYSLIQTPSRSVAAIADLDGNGKYEMVVGNKLGGLVFYRQVKNVLDDVSNPQATAWNVTVYPNPAADAFWLQGFPNENVTLRLQNLQAQTLRTYTWNQVSQSFSLSGIPAGMYLLICEHGDQKSYQKLIRR